VTSEEYDLPFFSPGRLEGTSPFSPLLFLRKGDG